MVDLTHGDADVMTELTLFEYTVCGVEELPGHSARQVRHVLSLLDPGWPDLPAFDDYDDHARTVMHFHDIIDPAEDKVMPRRDHVADILRLGADIARPEGGAPAGHMLVHCHMGVSRSTAAMISLLAQAFPDQPEDRLFDHLRAQRPQAWPNSVMIGHADDLLGRGGRLVDALRRHYAVQVEADPKFRLWMTRLGRERELEMARPG